MVYLYMVSYRFRQLCMRSELKLIRASILLACCGLLRSIIFALHAAKQVVKAHGCVRVIGHFCLLGAFAENVEGEWGIFWLGLLWLGYRRPTHDTSTATHAHGRGLRNEAWCGLLLLH